MPLTKATSPVIEDNIKVNTINGYKFSLFAEPMSIPVAGKSGELDSSWGTSGGSGGSGTGDMNRSTYDTNSDGKVDFADEADRVSGNGNNQFLYSDNASFQSWTPIDNVVLSLTKYDPKKTGKVNSSITADKISRNCSSK